MVKMEVVYQGQFHCELKHGPSGSKIVTDAPKDNMGKGEAFSPTDLVGAALGSCILTTMDIVAKRDGFPLDGAKATVEKHMQDKPHRQIAKLVVDIQLPAKLTPEQRKKMEITAQHCPVHRSLRADLEMPMTFDYVL